jgi:quercetin dioxygenase-like cupin family protein
MQQIKNGSYFFVLISVLFLFGCNEPATTSEKNDIDTSATVANSDISSMPAYDPAMEPLTVGAAFSKKLGDTLNIKMYEFTLKPGDSAAMHTHPDHSVYVLQGGKLAVTFQGKGRQEMNLPTGMGFIMVALSDAAKNIGSTTVKLLVTDIYRPRTGDASSMPAYNPALDPLTVGGASVKKLGDTLNIKMFEATVKPGESAPLHAHPDHTIYIIQGGKLALYAQGAERKEMNLKTGTGWIGGPLIDSAKNIGNTTIKVLETAVYRPRGK